jgi:MoaA/NifB/PqqE/SkfB family radical SAM enzyme
MSEAVHKQVRLFESTGPYLSRAIARLLRKALRLALANPREALFLLRFRARARAAAKIRRRAGETAAPAFLIASIARDCNLRCTGCYHFARQTASSSRTEPDSLSDGDWTRIFTEAASLGVSFILLAGGEPLTRRGVLAAAGRQPDILFPVFTNGTLFDDEALALFSRRRNLLPVISLEGGAIATTGRRGPDVWQRLTEAMTALRRRKIFFGASITVTDANLHEVTDDAFLDSLRRAGVSLVIFVEYVPVDGNAALVLSAASRDTLARRVKILQESRRDMLFLAFPGDEQYMGGCLAAGRGFFHINHAGGAEPCPFSPYTDTFLKTSSFAEALRSPLFARIRSSAALRETHEGGCALFEHEQIVKSFITHHS